MMPGLFEETESEFLLRDLFRRTQAEYDWFLSQDPKDNFQEMVRYDSLCLLDEQLKRMRDVSTN